MLRYQFWTLFSLAQLEKSGNYVTSNVKCKCLDNSCDLVFIYYLARFLAIVYYVRLATRLGIFISLAQREKNPEMTSQTSSLQPKRDCGLVSSDLVNVLILTVFILPTQVDWPQFTKFTRVATEGRQNADSWVKSYRLHYSYDTVYFDPYKQKDKIQVRYEHKVPRPQGLELNW